MKRKMLTVILTAAMAVSALAGCGGDSDSGKNVDASVSQKEQEEQGGQEQEDTDGQSTGENGEEPVLLRVFMLDYASGAEEDVSAYLNSLPQVQELGVEIEICKHWNFDTSNLPLQIAGDEQMDIGFDSSNDFLSRVDQQAYVDLSQYLENDPDFYSYIPEQLWKGVTIQGGIYGVPTYKEMGEQWAFTVNQNDIDACGIDASTINSLAEMEPLLAAMKEKDLGGLYIAAWSDWMKVGLFNTYDFVPYFLGGINRASGEKVENLYETREFEELVDLMYDWNQKGLIPEETLTDATTWLAGEIEKNNYCVRYMGYAPCAEYFMGPDWPLTPFFLEDPVVTNDAARGSIYCIYKKCKNPEKAYEFLKLWNTDPEVKNAILYGIPDVHYKLVDGQVQKLQNEEGAELYNSVNWASGNVLISYTTVGEPKDKYERYETFNASAVPSADLGIVYNFEGIQDKITNCTAVLEEYLPPLLYGYVEPESGLSQLREKLKEAGVDEVIEEMDSQFQAYKAAQ